MNATDYFGYTVFENGVILSKRDHIPMCPHDNGRGYLILNLRIGKIYKVKAVHRVVAEAFIPNPEKLSDVDHIDGDKRNNHVSNLRWVTHGENIKHCYTLENRSALGVNNARCKTSEEDIREVCRLLEQGERICKIRDKLNIDWYIISAVKMRKNWKHISKDYSW